MRMRAVADGQMALRKQGRRLRVLRAIALGLDDGKEIIRRNLLQCVKRFFLGIAHPLQRAKAKVSLDRFIHGHVLLTEFILDFLAFVWDNSCIQVIKEQQLWQSRKVVPF